MSEMIERVATAMRDKDLEQGHCDPGTEVSSYMGTARAAIEAMRKPTSYMIANASNALGQQSYGDVWRIMIDTVLNAEDQG
jgi:hypothetical protein